MCGDRSESLGGRIGRLTVAVQTLLDVIAEQPTALDPFHLMVVRRAEQALEEAGLPVAVTR